MDKTQPELRQDRIDAFVAALNAWAHATTAQRDRVIGTFLDKLVFHDGLADDAAPRPLTSCNCEGSSTKPTGLISKSFFAGVLAHFCDELGIPSDERLDVMVNNISRVIKRMRMVTEVAERLAKTLDEAEKT